MYIFTRETTAKMLPDTIGYMQTMNSEMGQQTQVQLLLPHDIILAQKGESRQEIPRLVKELLGEEVLDFFIDATLSKLATYQGSHHSQDQLGIKLDSWEKTG